MFWKLLTCCGIITSLVADQEDIKLNPHLYEEIAKAPKPRIGIVVGFSGTHRFGKKQIEECLGTGIMTYDIRPQIWRDNKLGERPVRCGATYAIQFIIENV